jgi:O-methyltransferase involved in polyketide biosynthesis
VLDSVWLEAVSAQHQRACLFLAEGVSMHLEEAQVKWLVLMLRDNFPCAKLVFDPYSPIHIRVSNLLTARAGFHCCWGLWHGQEIEDWGDGIRLLD